MRIRVSQKLSEGKGFQTYIAEADILDQSWVDAGTLPDFLQQGIDEVFEAGVFEAALVRLGERCSDGEGDDNVVRVLGGPVERETEG